MSTVAAVKLWGSSIGAVSIDDDQDFAVFEYAPDFALSGIEVAPLMMPLPGEKKKIFSFRDLSLQSFHGLPGLLADSLPDKFGNALINAWLARQNRTPNSFNAVERLCYTGSRGMGALEFEPVTGPSTSESQSIEVAQMVKLVSEILSHRDRLQTQLTDPDALIDVLQIGTSAGGARAKAVIAWNPKTNQIRSGQIDAGSGFEYWLLKFDGVSNNKDKEMADPQGYCAIEYAYSKMAIDCGINMSPCKLYEEGGRRHFLTKRFDRLENGKKLHMQSLGAMSHLDFNQAGAHSYEQAFLVMNQLGLPANQMSEMFTRMVFNVVARNQDDHIKNIAFLMDQSGRWALSPAFDMTYSYQPKGSWTSSHQMTINGKQDHFTLDDFHACGKTALLKKRQIKKIITEVQATVSHWSNYAQEAGVSSDRIRKIQPALRLDSFD